jgi:hypothetical protein
VYEHSGPPELWLVDDAPLNGARLPALHSGLEGVRHVALELAEGDVLTSPQLPRFELAIAELFAR